jgi:hypothetical protein
VAQDENDQTDKATLDEVCESMKEADRLMDEHSRRGGSHNLDRAGRAYQRTLDLARKLNPALVEPAERTWDEVEESGRQYRANPTEANRDRRDQAGKKHFKAMDDRRDGLRAICTRPPSV